MTTYEHHPNISSDISNHRPVFLLCCILFVMALLPFVFGLHAVQQTIQPVAVEPNSANLIYNNDCNPFGAMLSCVEVQPENGISFH